MNPTAELILPEVRELIGSGEYGELAAALRGIPPADLADVVGGLDPAEAVLAFRFLPRDDAGEVFAYLPAEQQERLVSALGAEGAVRVIEGMSVDDRARLLDELPAEVAQRLMASLNPEDRKRTQCVLGYPEGSVGRLMSPEYIGLRPEWTIARTLEHIRRHGRDAETINVVYVVDDHGRLVDDIRLRQILLADPGQTVESLMDNTFVTLRADQDQEGAVGMMARYDRVALPVTDSRGTLLGIVTHDDVADVAQQEATEDIQKLGGMEALDEPYMTIPIGRLVRKRGTWLAALFIGEMFTQTAMVGFEDDIARAAVLATFVPLIVSSGGNSGSQATSLIIRAMAVGEIGLKDWARVLKREVIAGGLLGLFLGAIGILRINVWGWLGWFGSRGHGEDPERAAAAAATQSHYHLLAVTVGVAVVGVVLWGTLIGSMLPFLLRRLKLDPATSSAPFVATLVDVVGVLIYFTAAVAILKGTLL